MSFLKKLFGGKSENGPEKASLDQHMDFLSSLRRPAVLLERSETRGFTKLGGAPDLPAGFEWPRWNGKPMAFLCQVDLGALSGLAGDVEHPSTGRLYFFYDVDQETWGYDPKHKGSWHVHFAPPDAPVAATIPAGISKEQTPFRQAFLAPVRIETYPDGADERLESLSLSSRQQDQYFDLIEAAFSDRPAHHLFGYPQPIQGNDMDLECQLVSNGIYCGDAKGYQSAEAKALESGRADWTLLLQLDTDDDAGMMWGDSGRLYFWIKKDDLRSGRFENTWTILQCY